MINEIDSKYQQAGLSGAPQAQRKDQLGQEDFLKLMTTQLANQDPFKPMESGEFMTQIAQFGSVQGIQDLQKSFDSFASSMVSNQSLQTASLVGRNVLAPAGYGQLDSSGLAGAVDVPANASDVHVSVYDSAGQLVKRLSLGAKEAGLQNYRWDGTADNGAALPPGLYRVESQAVIGNENVQLDHFAQAPVESVTFGRVGQEPQVNLAGLGSLPFSDLREIR